MPPSMPRLREIGVRGVDAGKRARARALFAAALETPGGLKVQTIHAFCTRLLQQFPFEANVAARFTVLDDRSQNEMFERAIMAVLLQAAGAPDSALGRALRHAVTGAADSTVRAKLQEAIRRAREDRAVARCRGQPGARRSRSSAARSASIPRTISP